MRQRGDFNVQYVITEVTKPKPINPLLVIGLMAVILAAAVYYFY